ncbi:BACON domain-containing protein [Streptomyces sp. NRRL F-2664]|uniref:BACON domain-containing protein n=1 Tax=Streptomyces sp. NRRL F-2664 TaxID=1463842 RepID=UPI0004CBC5E5|nr:sigma-70 family RNA polymerase sigma factor [Streptomyces sp. NRRL F-2664]
MNSSSQAQPSPRTGAHRAHGRTPQEEEPPRPFRHEPYLDGLFTYCLSVLCDHDTATDVLGDVLAVAERHPGRCPDEGDRRAWLYALARWACLRRLADQRRIRPGAHSARRAPEHEGEGRAPGGAAGGGPAPEAHRQLDVSAYRRTELARLAWPEAAGTTPAQREALELAVRHRLGVPELAAVLGTPPAAARELLTGAACEVERTRAALAVVETGGCPSVSQLTGGGADGAGTGGDVLLSSTLRAELVRHVDDCPRCRRVAERVGAAAPWPGSGGVDTAALPLVPAPRTAVHAAMLRSGRGRGRSPGPRFDRTGFPMDPRDRAARRDRLRARAVTTTVVATVVAAPVLALWASYRSEQGTGESPGDHSTRISASETELPTARIDGRPLTAYENTGNATGTTTGASAFTGTSASSDVSVEVISSGPPASPDHAGAPGRLSVAASSRGALTLLTLTASGGAPVNWRLWSDGPWLHASRTAGTLAPGESVTLQITVDPEAQPVGAWTAHVGVDPTGAVVSIRGRGRPPSTPAPQPEPTPPASPSPTPDQTQGPTPTPGPTEPTTPPPSPTPAPTPTDGTGGTDSPAPEPAPTGPAGG